MKLLRLLSGLAAWTFGRRAAKAARIASWYESTSLGEWCGPDTHCKACRVNGDCDLCDTIDGRHMNAIAEHAQTCDGCADLTENESLTMNLGTNLLYCQRCLRQGAGEKWAYKVWGCECGETVFTDTDRGHKDCPGCGGSMTSDWPSTKRRPSRATGDPSQAR